MPLSLAHWRVAAMRGAPLRLQSRLCVVAADRIALPRTSFAAAAAAVSNAAALATSPGALLNNEQEAAVATQARCVRVVAGPGSGKTLVLTRRIAHEITNNGVDPENVLCITFTNKAAEEVRDRLRSLIGWSLATRLTVSTFHSFCSRVLRQILPEDKPKGGLSKRFVIYDDDASEKILKDIYTKVVQSRFSSGLDRYQLNLPIQAEYEPSKNKVPKIPAEDLKRGKLLVSWANQFKLHSLVARKRKSSVPQRPKAVTDGVMKLASLYEESLRKNNAADFNDLISLAICKLHESSQIRQEVAHRWSYVLVDEFQDTDGAQYELIRLLCEENQNLFVVGDVDQAIYGWRGAQSRNMQYALSRDFPSIASLQLKKNYRSSMSILNVASKIIGNSLINRKIGSLEALTLAPTKPLGVPVNVCWLDSPDAESQYVANEIAKWSGRWEDCAILYRTHRQSYLLETALVYAGIPYRVLGSTALFSHKVVKDLLQYLQLILNEDDELAVNRIINTPPRGIGPVTLSRLKEWTAKQNLPFLKGLLKAKEGGLTHKELGITPKARTAVFSFCEMISSLEQLSHQESIAAVLRVLIDRTDYIRFVKDTAPDESTLEKRMQHIEQLLETAVVAGTKHGKGREALSSFLEDVMLIAEATCNSEQQQEPNAVSLSTLHAAKGMEFKCVFIVGLIDGTLPHENSDPEEERRLLYVGVTRAQEQLYLTHTHGYWFCKDASEYDNDSDEDRAWQRQKYSHQMSGFLKEIIGNKRVRLFPDSWGGTV